MERLSDKKHWDSVHDQEKHNWESTQGTNDSANFQPAFFKRLKSSMKTLLSEKALRLTSGYQEHLIWDVIYKKYIPIAKGAKVLEVGSAPGEHLVKLHQKFGLEPYGLDYSESGVRLNKEVFSSNNINPDNVIHGDFFSDDFHERYKESFDLVISSGFIEHFSDVKDVIQRHLNLVTRGGRLIIIIPNLRGINYYLTMLFHKEVIAIHNLTIMRKDVFAELFNEKGLRALFCDYFGVFSFYLFNTKENSPMRHLLKATFHLQMGLNAAFHLLFKNKPVESRWFSPSLIYIGVKDD